MATFFPPTIDDVPPVTGPVPPFGSGPPAERLFSHYSNNPRGRTVITKTDGTCVLVDWPVQMVPGDQSQGDPFTESGLAGIPYTQIRRVYMGGHYYQLDDAEVAQLTACGYGAYISADTWGELASRTWESLDTWENPA